jgi:hypothetical protein
MANTIVILESVCPKCGCDRFRFDTIYCKSVMRCNFCQQKIFHKHESDKYKCPCEFSCYCLALPGFAIGQRVISESAAQKIIRGNQ